MHRVLIATVVLIVGGAVLYRFGRPLWHPLLASLTGEASEGSRLADIIRRKPYLREVPQGPLTLIAYKAEKQLEVRCGTKPWRTIPILAASGHAGPKLQAGDNQVPEGLYTINAVNPNSSYYLSLRVSYPNAQDLARAQAHGVSDPGGDIYIHGHAASIGCLAMGDDAIEDLFWLVVTRGPADCTVIIAPGRERSQFAAADQHALHDQIYSAIDHR